MIWRIVIKAPAEQVPIRRRPIEAKVKLVAIANRAVPKAKPKVTITSQVRVEMRSRMIPAGIWSKA